MSNDEKTNDKSSKRKGPPFGDGSPITVGGGGGFDDKTKKEGKNRCTFDEAKYPDPEPGGNPKKKIFKYVGQQIKTFKIWTTATGTVDYSTLLPDDGVCDIEVKCKSSGDDVTIISRKSGPTVEFGIDMDTGTYSDKQGHVHENPDTSSYIYQVELHRPGANTRKWHYERDDNCAVCTDYVPPKDSDCY